MMKEPALGMLEFKSVARGIFATDVMVKKAPVKILESHPICPGKYMVLICGEVANVEESMKAGVAAAGDLLINSLFLPYVHRTVIPAINGTTSIKEFKSIGIIESFSISSCVVAADLAAKEAPIDLIEVRLAQGLGGKGYVVMTGELTDLQVSMAKAEGFIRSEGLLAATEIIAAPHKELIDKAVYW